MASRDALADLFQQIPLFAGCTKKDLKLVLSQAERVNVRPGQVLISEGQTGREFFMVLDGTATVSRRGRKVTTLGPGQSFGELALLDPAPRNATVTASTDMELVVLGQREFAKIVDATPGFARSLLSGMAQRVNAADSRDY
jgi:CRP/FNR family transcriptional regulator, cyclic AMP receptor protein